MTRHQGLQKESQATVIMWHQGLMNRKESSPSTKTAVVVSFNQRAVRCLLRSVTIQDLVNTQMNQDATSLHQTWEEAKADQIQQSTLTMMETLDLDLMSLLNLK